MLDEAGAPAVGLQVRADQRGKGRCDDSSSFGRGEEDHQGILFLEEHWPERQQYIKGCLNLKVPPQKAEGFMLKTDGYIVVDLGDDVYSRANPIR